MKRIFGIIMVVTWFMNLNAQVAVSDTAYTAMDNRDMTFYSLQTGQKTLASNTDWHIAVSVRPSVFPSNTLQGTTIRMNEANGVKVYQVPGFTEDSFSVSIDTAGFRNWQRFSDSDSLLDLGALNKGLNIGAYNYGWGIYSGPPNHNVIGKKVYLFELPGGAIKKFIVHQLDRDTAWDLKFANLDNSNLQTTHISKAKYAGKNFVYLNFSTNTVQDKEPLSSNWDLQFLKYSATDMEPGKTLPTVGVWSNKGTQIAKREGVNAADNDYSNLTFSPAMNKIGWNWKYLVNNQQFLSGKDYEYTSNWYRVEDSLAYFVRTLQGETYKVVFTGYSGIARGIISFYKVNLMATAIMKEDKESAVHIFPNPCHAVLNVSVDVPSTLKIFDLNGRMIEHKTIADKNVQLSTAEFANGIYLLAITTNGNTSVRRFAVNH